MKIKSRKHWYSYTMDIFLILLFVVVAAAFYYKTNEIAKIHPYFRIGILIFVIWMLYNAIRRIILKFRVEWTFENNTLTTKSGFLPWRRDVFKMDISQIYDAYYSKSFMGTLLGYGGLHIRRTDGVTSKASQSTMANHKKIISEINNCIAIYKKNGPTKNENLSSSKSLSDELKKLADLNKDGVISDDEFEKLKRKIIK